MEKKFTKIDFRKQLVDEFLELLEKDGLNYRKGWKPIKHYNGYNNKEYKGINAFALILASKKFKYDDPRWYTYNQLMELNENLSDDKKLNVKGQKGHKIEYWFAYLTKTGEYMSFSDAEVLINNQEYNQNDFKPVAKHYTVFNGSQVMNLERLETYTEPYSLTDKAVNTIVNQMNIKIYHAAGDSAYYQPSDDTISLPLPEEFKNSYEYNATLLHELAHATGHLTRLNRDLTARFKTPQYAFEELIAELSTVFTSSTLLSDITDYHLENHAAYVKSWLELIKDDPDILFKAIARASEVTAYFENHLSMYKEIKQEIGTSFEYSVEQNKKQEQKPEGNLSKKEYYHKKWAEELDVIKDSISIVDYAQEVIGLRVFKVSNNIYSSSEHDSLRIFNKTNSYTRFSTGKGGSIIDFIKEFHPDANKDSKQAILLAKRYYKQYQPERLHSFNASKTDQQFTTNFSSKQEYQHYLEHDPSYQKQELELPKRAINQQKMMDYLCKERCISPSIVEKWIQKGLVYQDVKNNVVFIGKDYNNHIKYAHVKGTYVSKSGKRFIMDVKGSDKNIGVLYKEKPKAKTLVITESVVDAMSVQTLFSGYEQADFLSLQSASNTNALHFYLQTNSISELEKIYIALDHDAAGFKGKDKIVELIKGHPLLASSLSAGELKLYHLLPKNKDFNDDLKQKVSSQRSLNNENKNLSLNKTPTLTK